MEYNLVNINKTFRYNTELKTGINRHLKQWAFIKYEPLLIEMSKAIYKSQNPDSKIRTTMPIERVEMLSNALKCDAEYNMALSKKKALKNQKNRFNKRIRNMLYLAYMSYKVPINTKYHCYFATLTFSEDTLKDTNQATRKTYISRFLKQYTFYYIANIDYGSLNEREHYHAIVLLDDHQIEELELAKVRRNDGRKFNHKQYKLGLNLFEYVLIPELMFNDDVGTYQDIIFSQDSTSCKIATYLNKLTNHGYKKSVDQQRLIYSDNKRLLLSINYYLKRDANTLQNALNLFGELEII